MKKNLTILIIISFISNSYSQNFEWIKSSPFNYSLNPSYVNLPMICKNNIIINANTDSIVQLFGQSSFGFQKIEVRDLSGNISWTFSLSNKCSIQQIAAGSNGIYYICGNYMDTLILNNTDTLFNTGSGWDINTFLLSLNSQGQLLWKKNITIQHPDCENISALECDNQDNCWYAYSDFNNGFLIQTGNNGNDVFSLSLAGAKTVGGMSFDPSGNLYVTGATDAGAFSIGNLNYTVPYIYSMYVARFNSFYQPSWANFAEDQTFHFPIVKTDPFGNAFVCSSSLGSTQFGNIHFDGPQWVYDFMAVKVDSSGKFIWGFEVPQQPTITGDFNPGSNQFISSDSKGNLYIAGTVRGTVDFGNGVVATRGNQPYEAISFLALDSSGVPMWTLHGGSNNSQDINSISIDNNDNIYFNGIERDTAIFDTITVITTGSTNTFLGKISNALVTSLSENNKDHSNLFPNPSTGNLIIPERLNDFALTVYNSNGRIIFHTDKSSHKMNLYSVADGLYLLNFSKGGKHETFRWMKSGN